MTQDSSGNPPQTPPTPRGRPRDASRDPVILEAALDVLCESGYDGMTLDAVAARAHAGKATLYRRWATKEQLMLAAISRLGGPFDEDRLPDTGALRSDLFAVVDSDWLGGTDRRVQIMAGLAPALTSSSELANAIHAQMTEPYLRGFRAILERAVVRGEVPPGRDLDVLAQLIPAMTVHRMMFARRPPDRPFLEAVIDQVLLPAVELRPDR